MRGSWAAQTVAPIPLDGVWRGPDPLSCLKSFAQAAGLDVLAPEPRLWLVGLPEQLDHAALVVFTYSMTAEGQPAQPTDADVDLARAIAAQLPIRQVAMEYEPVSDREGKAAERIIPVFMGIGTYWVPGEPDTLVAVVSRGAFTFATAGFPVLDMSAYKVRVTRDAGRINVDCLWGGKVTGPLIPGFAEDLDGDGLQEYFFQGVIRDFRDGDEPDLLVAGADGRATQVRADRIAVERKGSGPKHFALFQLLEGTEWPDAANLVYRFSPESSTFVRIGDAAAAAPSGAGRSVVRPEEALAAALGGGEHVKIFAFSDGGAFPASGAEIVRVRQSLLVPGAEIVTVRPHPLWGWFVDRAPAETIEKITPDVPIRIVYKVLTPGYLKVREREKEVLGR